MGQTRLGATSTAASCPKIKSGNESNLVTEEREGNESLTQALQDLGGSLATADSLPLDSRDGECRLCPSSARGGRPKLKKKHVYERTI